MDRFPNHSAEGPSDGISPCLTCQEAGGCSIIGSTAQDLYETHITVALAEVDMFCQDVRRLDMKPVLLDLHLHQGGTIPDLMTSSTITGTYEQALAYLGEKAVALEGLGYVVVRRKLETTPWNPRTPTRENGLAVPPGRYFESHLPITLAPEDRPRLATLAHGLDFHLSRNAFKRQEGTEVVMMTARSSSGPYEGFQEQVDRALAALTEHGFAVGLVIVEYAIYDSRQEHDAAWIG